MMKISSFLILSASICYTKTEFLVQESPQKISTESQTSGIDVSVMFPNSRQYREGDRHTRLLICNVFGVDGEVWWTADGMDLTDPVKAVKESGINAFLKIELDSENDTGEITCMAKTTEGTILNGTIHIRGIEPGKITSANFIHHVRVNESVTLSCYVEGYPLSNFTWIGVENNDDNAEWKNMTRLTYTNETYVTMSIDFKSAKRRDAGSYICWALDYYGNVVKSFNHLMVADVPLVQIKLSFLLG